MLEEWKQRPTLIDNWHEDVSYLMAIDENGTTDLNFFHKENQKNPFEFFITANESNAKYENDRWFTTTGVAISRDDFPSFMDNIMSIKLGHWNEGTYLLYKGTSKRVVFHSREIRKVFTSLKE